tara:strand:- start:6757 stop:7785 length:1029 start_codon:yes stop_codon:yes gene_type:complete
MILKNYLTLLVLLIFFTNCQQKRPHKKTELSSTLIKIDDRIQLFRVAYNLAIMDSIDEKFHPCRNEFYSKHYLPYKKFSNHPFVQKIANGDFWNGDLPILALALDKNLKPKKNLDATILKRQFNWYGENLDSVSRMMIDFKKTISFKNNYNINFKAFKDSIEANKITQKLNDFFRVKKNPNLIIYFDPLNAITSRAINFLPKADKKRRFVLNNVCEKPDSITTRNNSLNWNKDTRRIIFHENSHLYTNNLLNKYYSKEFDKKLNQEKFDEEYTNIDEIIVRAITAKIIQINYGEKEGEFEISRQPKKSRLVYNYLDNYISNEKMTFDIVYKEIMNKLEKSYN